MTLVLVALSAALELAPAARAQLGWERAAIERGELWRLLSGHLVHGSPVLAAVDLLVLLVLGAWWELRARVRLIGILVASALAASAALFLFTSLARYGGSSALSSGLFAAAGWELARSSARSARLLGLAALALLALKCALELTGRAPAGLVPLPPGTTLAAAAHLAGALGGGLTVALRR